MSTLGAARITKLSVSLATMGAWRADVTIETGTSAPTGKVTLAAGDLVLQGTATRGDLDSPSSPHVIVAGAPGWELPLGTLSYGPQAGVAPAPQVKLSTVLRDLAARAGETIEQPADRSLGPTWCAIAARAEEPLRIRDALEALTIGGYLGAWRVDPDGVTRFGPRILGAVAARATPLKRDASVGLVELGIDSPAAFLPGGTLDGATILRTVIRETAGKLSAIIFFAKLSIAAQEARRMARRFPALTYGYPRTYSVTAARADGTVDLAPPADAPHLPRLAAVQQWLPGGVSVTPKISARCMVTFRDAHPGRPVVTGYEPRGVPDVVKIDADAVKAGGADAPAAREGGTYILGTATGVLTFVPAAAPFNVPSRVKV